MGALTCRACDAQLLIRRQVANREALHESINLVSRDSSPLIQTASKTIPFMK